MNDCVIVQTWYLYLYSVQMRTCIWYKVIIYCRKYITYVTTVLLKIWHPVLKILEARCQIHVSSNLNNEIILQQSIWTRTYCHNITNNYYFHRANYHKQSIFSNQHVTSVCFAYTTPRETKPSAGLFCTHRSAWNEITSSSFGYCGYLLADYHIHSAFSNQLANSVFFVYRSACNQ